MISHGLLFFASLFSSTLAQDPTANIIQFSNISSTVKGNIVDLGFSSYQGYIDPATSQEFYLGIRYAGTPSRWQAPQKPTTNNSAVIQANTYGSICAQSGYNDLLGATANAGSEDCLFLNVWRPDNGTTVGLPVIFWIHGGGYGTGNGQNDPTYWQQTTGDKFVFVTIQYRLGAFGFLSSADVYDNGVVNAGLLDQSRALDWVQENIGSFGGDPNQVTIMGESAGAGSVMLHLVSNNGKLGTTKFSNAIMASPYLPKQYNYADAVPTKFYHLFAAAAGCNYTVGSYATLFDCLLTKDTATLEAASNSVSTYDPFIGNWAFNPVTDGEFLTETPSQALLKQKVNGARVLVGNNMYEGSYFVLANETSLDVSSEATFETYIQNLFPQFGNSTLANLYRYYPTPEISGGLYDTQLNRAVQVYTDAVFACPGNWIADAFSQSYRYLFDVPYAAHGFDVPYYLPNAAGEAYPTTNNPFAEFFNAMLGTFAISGVPTLGNNLTLPLWNGAVYGTQVNLTVTGETLLPFVFGGAYNLNLSIGGVPSASLTTGLRTTNGGLDRCEFWRSVAGITPS